MHRHSLNIVSRRETTGGQPARENICRLPGRQKDLHFDPLGAAHESSDTQAGREMIGDGGVLRSGLLRAVLLLFRPAMKRVIAGSQGELIAG